MRDDTLKVYHGDTLVCEVLSDQWRPVDELLDICDVDMDEFAKSQGWDDWDWDELHIEREYIDRV